MIKHYKLFLIFTLSLNTLAVVSDIGDWFKGREYDTHESYEFDSCKQHNAEDNYGYHVLCEEGELKKSRTLDNLASNVANVQKKDLNNNFLSYLKEDTVKKLKQNIGALENFEKCLENQSFADTCPQIVDNFVSTITSELKELRQIMAQMNFPGIVYSSQKNPDYFRSNLKHPFNGFKLKPLTISEKTELREDIRATRENFRQEILNSDTKLPYREKCIKPNPTSPLNNIIDESTDFCKKSMSSVLHSYVGRDVKYKNLDYEDEYYDKISRKPILTILNLNGEENKKEKIEAIKEAVKKLKKSGYEAIEHFSKLRGNDRKELIKYTPAVESFLTENGSNQIFCDIAQEVHESNESAEFRTDMFIAVGTLVAGGLCGINPLCLTGIAVVSATAEVGISIKRENTSHMKYYANVIDSQDQLQKELDRNITIASAPLALIGAKTNLVLKSTKSLIKETSTKSVVKFKDAKNSKKGLQRVRNFKASSIDGLKIEDFKTAYLHDFDKITSLGTDLNKKWITNANKSQADLFLDIENAAMKRLNDVMDKEMVTAFTNRHKDLVMTEMSHLLKDYPNISFDIYSNAKSIRYAFNNNGEELTKEFKDRMVLAFQNANKQLEKEAQQFNIPAGETPSRWFQGGFGATADQAGTAAKKSRKVDITRKEVSLSSFDEIETHVKSDINYISKFTQNLNKETNTLRRNGLTEAIPGTKDRTLRLHVIEALRKMKVPENNAVEKLRKSIAKNKTKGNSLLPENAEKVLEAQQATTLMKEKFGVKMSHAEAAEMMEYFHRLDGLTPGLRNASRDNANLSSASYGGMTGDIKGMGAMNIQQVAKDLARNGAGQTDDALIAIRNGEKEVTQEFNKIKNEFHEISGSFFKEKSIPHSIKCSGDDCVAIPKRVLSKSEEYEMIRHFAKTDGKFRLSTIPQGVPTDSRSDVAAHGELIEKKLIKLVSGALNSKIDVMNMKEITIATRMPKTPNAGKVEVVIVTSLKDKRQINQKELNIIRSYVDKAIQQVNDDILKESNKATTYSVSDDVLKEI